MLALIQEQKPSFWQLVSVVSLLLFAVAGFAIFSTMHSAHAQDVAECAGSDIEFNCTPEDITE